MNAKRPFRSLKLATLLCTLGVTAYGGLAGASPEAQVDDDDAVSKTSEGAIAATPTISGAAGWWGPLVVKGKLFNSEGEGTATVFVHDLAGNQLARHTVRPSIGHCNSHGACWAGGTFTTSFSVAEIGEALHAVCAEVRVTAYDNVLGSAAPAIDVFLPSCLN